MEVLSLNLSWLKRPAKQSSQILRQNHLFEGTVHSVIWAAVTTNLFDILVFLVVTAAHKHNSLDTEMKTTVFVMTLYVSN